MPWVTHTHITANPSVTVHPCLPDFWEQHSSLCVPESPPIPSPSLYPTGRSLPAHAHSSRVQQETGLHGNPVTKCQSPLWALCVEWRGRHPHMLPSRYTASSHSVQHHWHCCHWPSCVSLSVCKVIKYIFSGVVLKYRIEVFVLYSHYVS